MAKDSLEHSNAALNLDLDQDPFDRLFVYLRKASALSEIATSSHFANSNEAIIHDYMWVVGDLIDKAKEAFDEICEERLKGSRSARKAN